MRPGSALSEGVPAFSDGAPADLVISCHVPWVSKVEKRQPALEKRPQAFKKKKADWGLEDLDPYFLCCSSGFAEIRMKNYEKSGSERTFFKHWAEFSQGP